MEEKLFYGKGKNGSHKRAENNGLLISYNLSTVA